MKLIANRALSGDYGYVRVGQAFTAAPSTGRRLLDRGLAREAPENKSSDHPEPEDLPPASEVGARPPFRNLPVPDPEPAGVAPEGNPLLRGADLPEPRAADPSGRARRSRSNTK